MTLTLTRTALQQIPLLRVSAGAEAEAARRGCVLFFHGLGMPKDAQLRDLESLARRGYLAVGVDNVGHGERRYADFEARFAEDNPDNARNFLQAVLLSAREVPLLVGALTRAGLVHEGRIGIAGISMGGYITYAAAALEPRLRAAVVIVGSPEWPLAWPESPHRHLEAFARVALLSQTAGCDTVVPGRYAKVFHERLEQFYSDYAARFAYTDYPASDHLLEADWETLWRRTLEWFDKHLV